MTRCEAICCTCCCRWSASALALAGLVGARALPVPDLPSPVRDLGGEQALHPRAVREARRDGSGHRAARLLQPGARRAGLPARHRDRHAARLPARRVADADADVRSDHPGAAADLAAGLAAARPGAVPEVGAGGALRHRGLLDVADGASTRCRACARSRRTTGTSPRCCGCRARRRSRRSSCRRRCPTCSPASASASASPGWSSSPARC